MRTKRSRVEAFASPAYDLPLHQPEGKAECQSRQAGRYANIVIAFVIALSFPHCYRLCALPPTCYSGRLAGDPGYIGGWVGLDQRSRSAG